MTNRPRFAVLGAGNTGTSLAGILALSGFEVSFGELPAFEHNIKPIRDKGGIDVEGEFNVGFAEPNPITTNIEEAIAARDVIMFCSPAYGHEPFTRACAPYLVDGQVLVYISYFGALRMSNFLASIGNEANVILAETLNCIYVGDRIGPTKALVKRRKERLPTAALPSKETPRTVDLLNKAFNDLTPAKNVVETSINNNNPIGHVPLMILNAGWIEATEGGFASSVGRTSAVRKLEKALDKEKMEVAKALGFEKISNEEWTARFYRKVVEETGGQTEQPKYYSKESPSPGAMAPSSLKHRYLVEDIKYAYVPMASIGRTIGVTTKSMDSVIEIASIINQVNYWEEGANSDKLGLKGLNAEEINTLVS